MDVKNRFFNLLNFDPTRRHTGKELNEAFERGVWLATGHDGSCADDDMDTRGSVKITAKEDLSEIHFSYSDEREFYGRSVSVEKVVREEGSPAKHVSVSLDASKDGKKLRVRRFECLETDSLGQAKSSNYIVDRQTGTLFQETPTLS